MRHVYTPKIMSANTGAPPAPFGSLRPKARVTRTVESGGERNGEFPPRSHRQPQVVVRTVPFENLSQHGVGDRVPFVPNDDRIKLLEDPRRIVAQSSHHNLTKNGGS